MQEFENVLSDRYYVVMQHMLILENLWHHITILGILSEIFIQAVNNNEKFNHLQNLKIVIEELHNNFHIKLAIITCYQTCETIK